MRAFARRLSGDAGVAVGVVVVVLATAFLAGVVPGWFTGVAREALRADLEAADSRERDLRLVQAGALAGGAEEPFARAAEAGAAARDGLPPAVRAVLRDGGVVVDTPFLQVTGSDPVLGQLLVRLRALEAGPEDVRVIEGRPPSATVTIQEPERGSVTGSAGLEAPVTTIDVAVTAATARDLGVRVGDRLQTATDPGGPLRSGPAQIEARVTGIVELSDPAGAPWFGDPTLHRPDIEYLSETKLVEATALVDPAVHPALGPATDSLLAYTWRWPLDVPATVAADPGALAAGLAEVDAEQGGAGEYATRPSVRTGLLDLLRDHLRLRAAATAVLAPAGLGTLVLALVLAGLLAALLARRRRDSLALLRGRGASAPRLLGGQAAEGALLALPAAALAALAAQRAVGGAARPAALVAGGVAVAVVAVLTAAIVPALRTAILAGERAAAPAGAGARRLAAELAIAAVAVVGLLLLRRRGLGAAADLTAGAGPAGAGGGGGAAGGRSLGAGTDLWLAAVPALLGLAGGLLAQRLWVLPLAPLAAATRRTRGLPVALALRHLARRPAGAALPLVVLTLALSVATFGEVTRASIVAARQGAPGVLGLAVEDGFRLLAAVGLGGAAVALGLALLLSAPARARDLARLRALGAGAREVVALVLLETGPPVLVAALVGPALGGAVAAAVLPGLDLGPLTGLAGGLPVRVEAARLLAAAALAGAAAAAALLVTAWAALRARPDRVLRTEGG